MPPQHNEKITLLPGYGNLDEVRCLFNEYTDWLGLDLGFQGYEEELRNLPGKYDQPDGKLYLAYCGDALAGCIALRRFDDARCEMKRLYVRPAYRTFGIGSLLAERLVEDATYIGYRDMLLDTLETMQPALNLYQRMGFAITEPYYHNPTPGTVYLHRKLLLPS